MGVFCFRLFFPYALVFPFIPFFIIWRHVAMLFIYFFTINLTFSVRIYFFFRMFSIFFFHHIIFYLYLLLCRENFTLITQKTSKLHSLSLFVIYVFFFLSRRRQRCYFYSHFDRCRRKILGNIITCRKEIKCICRGWLEAPPGVGIRGG